MMWDSRHFCPLPTLYTPPPPPPNSMHPCIPDYSGGGGGRKSPSNKPPPPPSSIPPHIQLIGRNNKQQHTRTPNNRQQHTTTVDNSTLIHKITNVPLFKKLWDINSYFRSGQRTFLGYIKITQQSSKETNLELTRELGAKLET